MQKKLANIIFSTRLTATLFIVFAIAMITGTFLDASQETSPTPYTRELIYNAWWFEAIMGFFVINFVGNIFRFRLFRKEKWATLTLHLAFIFILLGAFITRYIGYEGVMPIREGATENVFLSKKTYITAKIIGDYKVDNVLQQYNFQREVDFSERLNNKFKETITYGEDDVTFELVKFVAAAEKDIVPDENGESYLKIVEAGTNGSHNHFIKDGKVQDVHNVLISLNKHINGAINITNTANGLTIQSPFEGEYLTMATGVSGKLVKDSIQPLVLRSRYVIGNIVMVIPKPVVKGVFDIVKKPQILRGDADGLVLKVTTNGDTKHVNIIGGGNMFNGFEKIKVGDLDIDLQYGSKIIELPFQIKLNDFIAERYPGTLKSYSSYASKVTVIDKEEDSFDYKIYMNNILNHKGYKFFQASFDQDEKGTVLSVNHDFWGTWITYLGYFLLYFGMLSILFAKNTRFWDLKKQLKKIEKKKAEISTVILLFIGLFSFAQEHNDLHTQSEVTKTQIDSVLRANIVPKVEAEKFGSIVIQDYSGRMMPMNTYASEALRKLSKAETYEEFTADQVFLSIQESPRLWYNVPILYLKLKKGDSIRKIIDVPIDQKHVSLVKFFAPNGAYKLAPYLDDAYKTLTPNAFQKEFKEIDQRVNLLYNLIEGRALKIFPVPNDENNKWISKVEFKEEGYKDIIKDSLYISFIKNGFSYYLIKLNNAKQSGDYSEAEDLLNSITQTQQKYGSEVMLSEDKIKAELLYNKYNIFKKLFTWYLLGSILLFVCVFIQIFKDKSRTINIAVNTFKYVIVGLLILHTLGLVARWYISGHAPWSDAYESMIYVSWATALFGLIFGRKSSLTIASTAFVTSILLMVAHSNFMDPAIANLQPVLNSYWLMIHVAIIVASYGPFTLGWILGIVTLLLMVFTTKTNKDKILLNIKELTIITEMALTVGLVMLAIGNFLGGMWANESWGRYWGWDPKETWALISIMVYAFVIHARLVPGLRGRWFFSLMSVVAFSFIIFTYFGVNFYLSGLHSYQSGQQVGSFYVIAIYFGCIALLAFFAYRKYAKYYKK